MNSVRIVKHAERNYKQYTKMQTNESTFKERVRSVVREIPRGATMSYKAVAEAAGNPKAARAVAQIMRKNYDPHVPCHRVIRSDGTLGGYNRGGEAAKLLLLTNERKN